MFDSKLLEQLRVLYVEDDISIRNSLTALFSKLFAEVLTASDGEEGYQVCKSEYENGNTIDVVISDITMPNMDGIEMLKLIKQIDQNIPFVLTTAYSDVQYFKEAIKLNVTHYAIKPINIKEVMVHIQEICAVKFQEKAIINKQKELEEYLNAIGQVALISKTDLEGNITYVNEIFCEISGYTQDELIGKPHSIVRHPETSQKTFEELWKTIQSGNIWKNKLKNLSKEGTSYYVNSTIIPILDKYNDEIIEYISIRFLTTQEEEEKRRFKKQVIKNMGGMKKDFSDLKKENETLKEKIKFFSHIDLIKNQLDTEKKRNDKFLSQIKHYEKEIQTIKDRSEHLIVEGKKRLNEALKEKKEYKKKFEAMLKKNEQLENLLEEREATINRQEGIIVQKNKRVKNLFDVIDYREGQLTKLGIRLEPHKREDDEKED